MEKKWDFWTYTVILGLQIHQGAIVRAKVYLTVTSKKKKEKRKKAKVYLTVTSKKKKERKKERKKEKKYRET